MQSLHTVEQIYVLRLLSATRLSFSSIKPPPEFPLTVQKYLWTSWGNDKEVVQFPCGSGFASRTLKGSQRHRTLPVTTLLWTARVRLPEVGWVPILELFFLTLCIRLWLKANHAMHLGRWLENQRFQFYPTSSETRALNMPDGMRGLLLVQVELWVLAVGHWFFISKPSSFHSICTGQQLVSFNF